MDSPHLALLLISADTQLADEWAALLCLPVPTIDVVFVVETAVSLPQAIEKLTTPPDVVLLYSNDELQITAVADQFPHAPIVLITDNDDNQTASMAQTSVVADVLPRAQLTAPLLVRVLNYVVQMRHYATIQDKAHEHRQISEALLQASVDMNAILDYDELLDGILKYVADFFPYDMATIMLVEANFVRIERLRTADVDDSVQWLMEKASNMVFPLEVTRNLREVVENGRYLVIPNIDKYPDWFHIRADFHIRSWIGVPLIVEEQIMGILTLDSLQPDVYQDDDGQMLEAFAAQAALALHNAHIHQKRQREVSELSALHAIAQTSTEASTMDELLTRCTQIVAEKLYPDSFGFILVNDDGVTMSAHHAVHNRLPVLHPEKLPIGTGIVGQVIQTGQMRHVSDIRTDEKYADIVVHTHSELCVPLRVRGQIIGAINAESILFDAFTEADERFLVTLSQQLATGIERIQLLEAERRNREEAEKLRDAAAFLTTSLDLEQVFNNILSGLEEVVPHDSASVMLLHGEELVVVSVQGFEEPSKLVGLSFQASELFDEVRQTKRPLYLANAQQDPRFTDLNTNTHIRSWICLPLIVREQVLGVLNIDNEKIGVYGAVEAQLAQSFANQAAIAIDNARLYAAEQQARERAEIMREASSMMVQTLDIDTILDTLLDYLHKLVPFDSASVLFVKGDFAQIHLAKSVEKWTDVEALKQLRINVKTNGIFQEIVRTQSGLLISDVHNDSRWEAFDLSHYVRSWIGVPIIAGGQLLGCFSIDKAEPGYFNERHLDLIEGFTSQAAILLQNAQLFQETQQRAMELEQITTLSAALRETVELDRLLEIILKNVLQLVNGTLGGIYLIDSESGDLILRAIRPHMPHMLGLRQTIKQGIVGFVARTGRVYVSPDFQKDPLLDILPNEDVLLGKIRSGINLPLRVQERVVGVFNVGLDKLHDFSDTEVKLLTAVAEIAGTAIDRAIVLDTLEQRVVARTWELAKVNERLTELDRLKTKFVSDVSHELRTPITNLSLYLDLMKRGKPERREQYAAVLRQQVDRLAIMLEDILNISRLDMGKTKLHIVALDVNKIVQQVVEKCAAQMDDNTHLLIEFYPDMPLILGDAIQVAQVLKNLLNNAISYTPNGSIHIKTCWDAVQNRACVVIKDTGIGIPARELDHVFDRFYRGSNVSQSTMPGTGLGLSLVKELVDLHRGEIEIESEIDTGTTIIIHLPIAPRLSAVA